MVRKVRFYPHCWILLIILLQISSGCDQPKFVSDIEEIATSSLVYLHIECGVSAIRNTSGCIIQPDLVATNNFCAKRMTWGSAIAAKDGLEYRVESAVGVHSNGNLATVRVTGLGGPTLKVGNSNTVRNGDRVYIAVHPLQHSRGSMIGKVTRTPGRYFDDLEIIAPHSFYGWRGAIVLNYEGELIGLVSKHAHRKGTHGFATPTSELIRILGRGFSR